ncbi:MAG: ABC transporter substrate-binding protein [Flavobacteriaceae bacterium]|nr:ABC transporter substrate-binding protein [Mangrovimonas sp.]MCB0438357.1 ABC transporter substrate-binding protein [Mangrovimonas sp.]
MNLKLKYLYIVLIAIVFACKSEPKKQLEQSSNGEKLNLKYATGFSVENFGEYSVLEIKNPWPKAEKTYKYALIPKENLAAITLNKDEFEGILTIPVEKIVVTSTTHIPALELLGVEQTLVGFPGTDYVSSEKTRTLIDQGKIRELGKNEGINTEVLLELKPDVVVGFGIDGNNRTFETIQKSGIPVIYNGDWVEESPLAKAEWTKFFGVLFNKEKEADSVFNHIEKEYLEAKKLAANVKHRPTVLSGALEKDVWYLPSGTSPEAQLLKDANAEYLWQASSASGSLALSFESVFEKAQHAELWISPSFYPSLEALEKANEHYTQFDAFKTKHVYSFVNSQGSKGGITYFELGTTRPDLVLKDLIKICHPELLQTYQTTFFKPLD